MNARSDRVARNESLFREVNERISEVVETQGPDEELEVLCECGREGCRASLTVPRAEYEAVRGEPDRFLLAPDHELRQFERVVRRGDGYVVVDKTGHADDVAEETDPRRRPG